MHCAALGGSALSKRKQFLAGALAVWFGWAAQVAAGAEEKPQSNWTSADEPCANYDDLRRNVLGDIGVKIDASEPWANGFRKALSFWNSVLVANFHEETRVNACAIRIIDGGPDILNNGIVSRSQLTGWDNFRGKIAVSPRAEKELSSAEIYGIAVHELGHMLGLKHNASSRSVMYFLNVNGTEALDSKDILDLSSHHRLRAAAASAGLLTITMVRVPAPLQSPASKAGSFNSEQLGRSLVPVPARLQPAGAQ